MAKPLMRELTREQAREAAQRIFAAFDDSNPHLDGEYDSISVEHPFTSTQGYRVVLYLQDWSQTVRFDRVAAVCQELGLPFVISAGDGEEAILFDSSDRRHLEP